MPRFVVTGGLGVGKTSVITRLGQSVKTVPEPARELIAEHRSATGEKTLDDAPEVFVNRLIARSVEKYRSVSDGQVAVFDRGLPDCVAYAAVNGIDTRPAMEVSAANPYESPVFVAPPWRDIYINDDMRKATFAQAEAFYSEVIAAYDRLGYELIELPKVSVEDRVALISSHLP